MVMNKQELPTAFAPAERASSEEMERQSRLFTGEVLLRLFADSVPVILVALNQQRQIVFANQRLFDFLGPQAAEDQVHGRRPGEVLGCSHAFDTEGGCGTTEFCSTCGAIGAILSSQQGQGAVQECRIARQGNLEALDLRAWATPATVGGEEFTIFAVVDISHEKRREALERVFLHDLLNVAGGLQGYSELLTEADPDECEELSNIIHRLSRELIQEIQAQKALTAAESGDLVIHPERVDAVELLQEAVDVYSNHAVGKDRHLRMDDVTKDAVLVSDRALLRRVMANLVKNALEASEAGQTVTLGCAERETEIEFWVHNVGFMPRPVQLQIFQRSFSTKGTGRGLGTYSVKLLTEGYLKGNVSFSTSPDSGTTFRVRYPLVLGT
jgi:signal transduction histidine kinase